MSDKIRQAVFSSLAALGLAPDRVLDLYAGTGSIGIEALSRGANWADFVEEQPAACAVIRANLSHTKQTDRAQVHQQSVESFIRHRNNPYDLIILDPPYADPHIYETLYKISKATLVQSGTVVVLGHSPRLDLPERVGKLDLVKRRCHGVSCFSIFEIP